MLGLAVLRSPVRGFMTKTLYLHVGMPKCASTTIQGVLSTHAALFAQHGKFYGMPPGDTTREQGNATKLLADIRNERAGKVRAALAFFLERDSDVILSSEMFISLGRSTQADKLVARVREAGFEMRLICYLRRQDHWIESDYKQHLKGGLDWSESIDNLLAKRVGSRTLNYHWMLENWARSLPRENITVVPLHKGQSELYPLERFLSFLDMDPGLAGDMATERQNVSPPVGLIEPMRYLKAALLAQGMKPAQVSTRLGLFLEQASARVQVPPRRFLLPLDQRAALLQDYAASNADLSRDYLDGAAAFDATLEEEEQPLPPLVEEAAAVFAAWIASDPGPPAADTQTQPEAEKAVPAQGRWWSLRRD